MRGKPRSVKVTLPQPVTRAAWENTLLAGDWTFVAPRNPRQRKRARSPSHEYAYAAPGGVAEAKLNEWEAVRKRVRKP